jgi:probable HAF family extracellular repeat protein
MSSYDVTLINVPGAILTDVVGVNDNGVILGNDVSSTGVDSGFEIINGHYVTLDDPAFTNTVPIALNDSNQATGFVFDSGGAADAFLETNGHFVTISDSSATDGTYGEGLSGLGEVVGFYITADGTSGFEYLNGHYTTINDPNGSDTFLLGVNNSGEAIGGYDDSSGNGHSFEVNKAGQFTEIADPKADLALGGTFVNAINNLGEIVGGYNDASGNSNGFLYANGHYTTIDDPLGVQTVVEGISQNGEYLTGYYITKSGAEYGFVESGGHYTTINSGTGSTEPLAVNNSAEVVGIATNASFAAQLFEHCI